MRNAVGRLLLIVGIVGSVLSASKIHAAQNHYDYTGSARFGWSLALIVILMVTAYGLGLPELPRSFSTALAASIATLGIAAVVVSVSQLVLGDALLPRFVLGTALAALLPWFLLCWRAADRDRARRERRDRVFLIASDQDATVLEADLQGEVEVPARLMGHLTLDAARSGDHSSMVDRVVATGATVLVLSRDAQADETIVHAAAALHGGGMRIRTLSLFYEQWLGKLPMTELERVSLLYDIGEVHRAMYSRASRVVDIALALAGTATLVALVPFVLVGNALASRGPLLYRQPRIGKNGVEFSIVKFRTMRPTSGGLPNEWTTEDDPRITPFGRLLRRTHIDEMPQMINILRGDLSLVGPRPEQPQYVEDLTERLPFYDLRHLVTPGLTGWAQVKYGYAGNQQDALEKLQYEFYYLRHQGLLLDLRIVARTLQSVLRLQGR